MNFSIAQMARFYRVPWRTASLLGPPQRLYGNPLCLTSLKSWNHTVGRAKGGTPVAEKCGKLVGDFYAPLPRKLLILEFFGAHGRNRNADTRIFRTPRRAKNWSRYVLFYPAAKPAVQQLRLFRLHLLNRMPKSRMGWSMLARHRPCIKRVGALS
jgi:hypothetical protein